MSTITMAKKKRGRPRGSRTQKLPVETHQPSTFCPKCKSSERENYQRTVRKVIGTMEVVWRRTSCKICGQSRVDKSATPVE